jgi:hypothetical protein
VTKKNKRRVKTEPAMWRLVIKRRNRYILPGRFALKGEIEGVAPVMKTAIVASS